MAWLAATTLSLLEDGSPPELQALSNGNKLKAKNLRFFMKHSP